jgi:Leucine-rich repeat (LRR) protein
MRLLTITSMHERLWAFGLIGGTALGRPWNARRLVVGMHALLLGACHSAPPARLPPDALVAFRAEMLQLQRPPTQLCFTFARDGQVVALTISNSSLSALPKTLALFPDLQELCLVQNQLVGLPDLRAFPHLRTLEILNNPLPGTVHLTHLPRSLNSLTLNRDEITDVVVDDTLPHLTHLVLHQHRMTGINRSFCKLPQLEELDLSSGCCWSHSQKLERVAAAQRLLCKDDVFVTANQDFTD